MGTVAEDKKVRLERAETVNSILAEIDAEANAKNEKLFRTRVTELKRILENAECVAANARREIEDLSTRFIYGVS